MTTPPAPSSAQSPAAFALVVAVAGGVVAQGGYYRSGRLLFTVLVAIAVVLAMWSPAGGRPERGAWWLPAACAALGAWALVRTIPIGGETPTGGETATGGETPIGAEATIGVASSLGGQASSGSVTLATAAVFTLGGIVAATEVLRRAGPAAHAWLADALLGIGALVAVSAWAGVAWRLPALADPVENRLWRGSSTLTYPNAAAALLVPLALLALAGLAARPAAATRAATAYLLLVGIGAALSRAGLIALAAGLVALALLAGVRAVAASCVAPLAGAAVATAGLVPSFPTAGPPRPAWAVLALLVGAALAVGVSTLPRPVRVPVALAGLLAIPVAVLALGPDALRPILDSRATLASSGRSGAFRAAWDLVERRPLTGWGIGNAMPGWIGADGVPAVARYVHNEYLQILVDLGAIGSAALLGLTVAVVATIRRGRGAGERWDLWAGSTAGVIAFAVHSGADFLWHIPVLPFVAAILVGLAGGPLAADRRAYRAPAVAPPSA